MNDDRTNPQPSTDFFFDNQMIRNENNEIFCLGRKIYKVAYDRKSKEYEVVQTDYGYLKKGNKLS